MLYFFWVMQVPCLQCRTPVDLFPSWVIARNAYPSRKPEVQILCPSCGDIFPGLHGQEDGDLPLLRRREFNPDRGPAKGAKAACRHCHAAFTILDAVAADRHPARVPALRQARARRGARPRNICPPRADDHAAYRECSAKLSKEELGPGRDPAAHAGPGARPQHPPGHELCLHRRGGTSSTTGSSWPSAGSIAAIARIADAPTRAALLTLFSGVLEFNNMFASYKGEGTGAVRHMFSHHILKPERTPIEANVWGTPKSSGSFSNLFRSRLLRAVEYRLTPTEVNGTGTAKGRVCAPPFTGRDRGALARRRPVLPQRAIYLSCGDSAATGLPDRSIDLIVTDPPFFDNVHYSELADFFHAWRQLTPDPGPAGGDDDATAPRKSRTPTPAVSRPSCRASSASAAASSRTTDLLAFTYHHSRDEGWTALAEAVLGAGFAVVNCQPVKAEMSVATPKSQAKEPIQLDIIIVCRKARRRRNGAGRPSTGVESARAKLAGSCRRDSTLPQRSQDRALGQLLTTLESPEEVDHILLHSDSGLDEGTAEKSASQLLLFS